MIFDQLRHAPFYHRLHPAFAEAFAYLEAFDPAVPDGNYPLAGGCEARVMSYATEPASQKRWESHRRFIDIQFVVSGREAMQVADIGALVHPTAYDEALDVLFYERAQRPEAMGVSVVPVGAGEFTVFFPTDGHRPGIAIDAPADVRKIVIKVPVEQ